MRGEKIRIIKEYVGKFLVATFFRYLARQEVFNEEVIAFHYESVGSKRFISDTSITGAYFSLDQSINLNLVPFIRVDFALTVELANNKDELSLYVETDFYNNLRVPQYTILGSEKIHNLNVSLVNIQRSKLKRRTPEKAMTETINRGLDPQRIESVGTGRL